MYILTIITNQTTFKEKKITDFIYTGIGSTENVALHKPANQSSTYSDAVAGRAVDGITKTDHDKSEGGCTATDGRTNEEWWMVNLGKPYAIINITIFNRDGSCKNYFLWVEISESSLF